MRITKLFILLTVVGALLFSCSDKKKDNGTNQEEQPPQGVTIEPVQLPASMVQSTDANAQLVVTYVNFVNLFQSWTSSLMPPGQVGKLSAVESATDGPPWVYTWTQQGVTVTLTIDIENNQYHWVLTYTGLYEGIQLNKTKLFEAWENLDGTSGSLILYNPENNTKAAEWTWQNAENGTTTVHFISYDEQLEITVVQNADLSGSIEVKENNVLTFKAIWNGDGSGQWWTYDENGEIGSGTWT